MKDSVQFLNRKGEKFDWNNDDLDDLEIKKDPSKLIHFDVLVEFPGMELQPNQNTPSRVTVRTEPDPTKQAAAARVAAGLDAPPEASATTRGVNDTAHTADGTGDVDRRFHRRFQDSLLDSRHRYHPRYVLRHPLL